MTNAEREFWENEGEYEAYEEDYAFGETEASLTPPSAASPRESQAYVIPSRPQPGRIHDEVWETLNYCKYSAGAFRHNYYESTLETVRVHSVSVEGNWDEPSCAMRVDSIDRINSIENVGREYTDYPEPDWYAKLDGETFTISWRNRTGESLGIELTGSKNRVVWTCGVNVVDVENQLDSLMEENAILNVYRHVCGHKGARTVQECKSGFANLLLAYLQAHAGECDTPRDADDYAEAFFDYVLQGSLQMYRAYYTPSMVSLVNGAVRAARPTSTGIDALDGILGGGLVPGVYIIGGDPGAGKTALAVQALLWSAHECGEDERVVYVMLDQGGTAEVAKRLISLTWKIHKASKGYATKKAMLSNAPHWSETEVVIGSAHYEELTHERAILLDLMDGSFARMMQQLDDLITYTKVRLRLVVVDYYQLLRDIGGNDPTGASVATDTDFASDVIRRLRTWATDNGTPVLLVGQFTKESIERHAKGAAPSMTDLLGSVDVPYQSEAVITLTNAHDGTGIVELADTKHRHAGNDAQEGRRARLLLDGEHGFFAEVDAALPDKSS